jgi:uncharacterized protein YjbI with pentapeptide repeats
VFAAVAVGVTLWLLAIAGSAKAGTDRANARLDAVRTGLAAGAGAGAAVGLLLAFRRQHHQEVATVRTDFDATERRITELYTKAVEQLGSDKAPVRLGGLYALERLAQDNPAHRQTIVNVICAYLRMPFPPAAPTSRPTTEAGKDDGEPVPSAEMTSLADRGEAWQQERQVRLTAQRVLREHLRDASHNGQPSADLTSERFWPGIRLDLTGATLIDFGLRGAVLAGGSFGRAIFTGHAGFAEMTFSGPALFGEATFTGDAQFHEATFTDDAEFSEATFTGSAGFSGVTFRRAARFEGVTFTGDAYFRTVEFTDYAEFSEATFTGRTGFEGARFDGPAIFQRVLFSSDAVFEEATFSHVAGFSEARFGGRATFDRATFGHFGRSTSFYRSRVLSADPAHVWPAGWRLDHADDGKLTVVRANSDDSS